MARRPPKHAPPSLTWPKLLPTVLLAMVPAAALEVEYGGCHDVLQGTCLVRPDDVITVWVRPPADARVTIRGGRGGEVPAAGTIQGGQRYAITPTKRGRKLVVDAGGDREDSRWSLPLAPYRGGPDPLHEVRAAISAGDLERALAEVKTVTPRTADVVGLHGRIENMRGETASARQLLRQAIAAQQQAGRSLAAVKDATVLAYSLMVQGRQFDAATEVLTPFADGPQMSAEARYYLAYFRGLLAWNAGDDRRALRQLGAAVRQAERMGWEQLQITAEQMLAIQLQQLGRRREAEELLSKWIDRLDTLGSDCGRAMFLNNVGWTRLLVLEAGESARDPLPPLRRAYEILSADGAGGGLCNNDAERVNAALNLALAELHAGNADSAERFLQAARAITDTPELRLVLWSLDIEARLALLRGDTGRAIDLARRLRELGEAGAAPEAVWRGTVRQALALQQLGDTDAAVMAFAEADALIDDQLFRVPMSEGRETLLANYEWATQQQLQLLLDQGNLHTAWQVARRAGSRALRSLRPDLYRARLDPAERRAWQAAMDRYLTLREELAGMAQSAWLLPRDELDRLSELHAQRERELDAVLDEALAALGQPDASVAPALPARGVLELSFARVAGAWVVFAAGADGVEAWPAACAVGSGTVLAQCLIDAAAPAIAQATFLRVLLRDELAAVDFHALDFASDALLAQAPIEYDFALRSTAARAGAAPSSGQALLVGDTLGNLPAAQIEIQLVDASLATRIDPSRITSLVGRKATLSAVRADLPRVDLLHYAGHARALGPRGWDSELVLGERTSLDISDVLALPRVPRFVVLSGCETAAVAARAPGQIDAAGTAIGIGLAQAFLASGAELVVATARPVRDRDARAIIEVFYREWLSGTAPAVALQQAQLQLRAASPAADWAAFRLLRP